MFDKVLIANRGAIACRILRSLRRLGVRGVAVYSEADAPSRHVGEADEAVCIGPAPAAASYLHGRRILEAARATGAQAIHPGYGFLSENAEFAEACEAEGIAFVGPTPAQIRAFGLKHSARALAEANGLPLAPGSGLLADACSALEAAEELGYPLMLKSTAGGGGIGMRLCRNAAELRSAFDSVARLARNNFGDAGLFLERCVERARHIEVQIFGDGEGRVLALGERDCSLQRRNQKVVEEAPAPKLPAATRQRLLDAAVRLTAAVHYRSAGTVEFIYDDASGEFYFLEVNTRLQVEHGVTEEVTGVDLVEWMLRLAAGDLPRLDSLQCRSWGHSVQVRIYAEDPARDFQPATGLLTEVRFPQGVRVDSWVETGTEIGPHYDPMIAKLIVRGVNREEALKRLRQALAETRLAGLETNLDYLREVARDPVFLRGEQTTRRLAELEYRPRTVEVLDGGTQTTVQDWPGRLGHWDVGVPPSGPMDDLAFRLGNRILGNPEGCAGLELTFTGPTLRFNTQAVICLAGAAMAAELDGRALPGWQAVQIPRGAVLRLGAIQGPGARSYLLIKGGVQVPEYLGSRSTFTLGRFGGHGGRALRAGDVLHIEASSLDGAEGRIVAAAIPDYRHRWEIKVAYGPHGAPDFFTQQDMETFFEVAWEVHYNSSRTGVRLIGPKPEWARTDGGEAGLHPSNIHDNAYAVGSVDFTGDMPVILGPDGPSLGGFVCPATVIRAELWKLGQLRPGDRVRFVPVDLDTAYRLERRQRDAIGQLRPRPAVSVRAPLISPVLDLIDAADNPVAVTYRPCGDHHLLVEYGPLILDIDLRFRVHALWLWLKARSVPGIIDLTPGVRSLQVHYDSQVLRLPRLMDLLHRAEEELGDVSDMEVATRVVHLPLAWDDSATRLAIRKYMQSVRSDAPWCPGNIEFIRRINGLASIEELRRIVSEASYLVMGLGDVYLGAPVATPLDPRHRLVTTKYNPARTWTPENAVGIGGSYLCIYGMEGPGGYQFVGRTLQVWSRYRRGGDFQQPWLLRFFDQIRFYLVSEEELLRLREDFARGRHRLQIEEASFRLRDYNAFLEANRTAIAAFKTRQQAAFEAERARWAASGQAHYQFDPEPPAGAGDGPELEPHQHGVDSHVQGSVWQVHVMEGQSVQAGDPVAVIESMKMEITVTAARSGVVSRLLCREGVQVSAGQRLMVIDLRVAVKEP